MKDDRKPTMTLVAFAPDGAEIKFRTAAQYDWAGLAQNGDGSWSLVAKGWSQESVRSRTRTQAGSTAETAVVKFSETTSAYAASQREKFRAAKADEPVDWAGRTFGQLSTDEKQRAAKAAGEQLGAELAANADAISAVLDPAPHGWTVMTFDGQRHVGTANFDTEEIARRIARGHRDTGFTTRVRPAGAYGQPGCCESCTDENWAGRGYHKDARSADQHGEDQVS